MEVKMEKKLKLVIPKGRIFQNVINLLNEAGFNVRTSGRELKPVSSDPMIEMKILKPQNIPQLVSLGSHDIGFAGTDWCIETGSNVEKILELGFDKVKLVTAIPQNWEEAELKKRRIVVVSEYENISKEYLTKKGYDYLFLRVSGATEVFPPEDADMIIDNTATGTTLKENGLKIIDEIMTSSTMFIANPEALKCDWKKEKILEMKMLFESILTASKKVMLEMNIPADKADIIIPQLPCMKSPTVAKLFGEQGYSAKIVVNKKDVATLIVKLIALGATDILEYDINKVIVS
jgi:ATP phosphoribosyltransferase